MTWSHDPPDCRNNPIAVTFDYTSPSRYLSHDTWVIQGGGSLSPSPARLSIP
jgi:hypothetical protein